MQNISVRSGTKKCHGVKNRHRFEMQSGNCVQGAQYLALYHKIVNMQVRSLATVYAVRYLKNQYIPALSLSNADEMEFWDPDQLCGTMYL